MDSQMFNQLGVSPIFYWTKHQTKTGFTLRGASDPIFFFLSSGTDHNMNMWSDLKKEEELIQTISDHIQLLHMWELLQKESNIHQHVCGGIREPRAFWKCRSLRARPGFDTRSPPSLRTAAECHQLHSALLFGRLAQRLMITHLLFDMASMGRHN